jgi:hypothetical protein
LLLTTGAVPAHATHAPAKSQDKSTKGGYASITVKRSGWGVHVAATTYDTAADGDCAFTEVKVIVNNGPDRKRQLPAVCGKGESDYESVRVDSHGTGTSIPSIDVKVCRRVNNWPDDCSSNTRLSLGQHYRHATSTQLSFMYETMSMPMRKFLRRKRNAPAGYDWTDDGCSVPHWMPDSITETWERRFHKACLRHDFGYRNYGRRYLDATDPRRMWIDDRFLRDMQNICDANDWSGCDSRAQAFKAAVTLRGGNAFYRY